MANIDNYRFLNLTGNGNYTIDAATCNLDNSDHQYLSVNYNGLSGVFIEAIKELNNMVVSLQNDLETLKKQ